MPAFRARYFLVLAAIATFAGDAKSAPPERPVLLAQQSPAPNRTAPPPDASWPNAANTGIPAGTTLTVVEGNLKIETPGTIIDGKDIRGCVQVLAAGVIIRHSKIHCTFAYAVLSGGFTGERFLIEDSEIECSAPDGKGTPGTTAVGDNTFTARRLNIHHCENGFDVDLDVTIQDNWIHDLTDDPQAHTDGIQFAVGRNVLVEHNAIYVIGTSAIITHPTSMDGVVIRNNLMAGGAYTLYCPRQHSANVHVIGNRFSRALYPRGGAYGVWTDCHKVAELRDNVWDDTGQPLAGQPIPRPPRD
jgi:hypothetical protein